MTQRITAEVTKVSKRKLYSDNETVQVFIFKVGGKVLVLNNYEYRKFREALTKFDIDEALNEDS